MRPQIKSTLTRALLTLLLGLGLAFPLLGALGLSAYLGSAAAVILVIALLLSASGLHRIARMAVPCVLAGTVGLWLLTGGAGHAMEVMRALALHVTGLTSALPLVGHEAAILFSLMIALCSWLMTSDKLGGVPASVVTILMMAMLWMSEQPQLLPWVLPAAAASITLMGAASHEGQAHALRILPWMAAIAAAACLLTPGGGVTIDPMKEAADTLRQRIYDYLFFTSPRNVFSLANEGYYPQGQSQLGGTAMPDEHPVMMVQTPSRVYLRGVVKDAYNGHTWIDTTGGPRYLWISPTRRADRDKIFDMLLPSQRMAESSVLRAGQVTVTMLTDSTSTLFLPQRLRTLTTGGDMVPYFNNASEVFITRDLKEGDVYTASALLAVGGDGGLETLVNACAANADEALYQQIRHTYTALPDHLQTQVFQLAHEAAGDASTPYAQAMAVQHWLSSNYRYSLEVEPQPENVDFVGNFLLNTRTGYCTYFASAMTVMCRMLGLPARYVEGYLAEPNADGVAYVTGMQGHAWTEVYFAGFGWVTFDATPVRHDVTNDPNGRDATPQDDVRDDQPTPTPDNQDQPTPTPHPTEQTTPQPTTSMQPQQEHGLPTQSPPPEMPDSDGDQQDPPPMNDVLSSLWWLWLLLLLIALIAALVIRILMMRPEALEKRAKDDEQRWDIWAQAVHDALVTMKLPKQVGESPMAYFTRMAAASGMPQELRDIGDLEAMFFYGRYVPGKEEADFAKRMQQAVYAQMNRRQKLHWLLLRGFTQVKKRRYTSA